MGWYLVRGAWCLVRSTDWDSRLPGGGILGQRASRITGHRPPTTVAQERDPPAATAWSATGGGRGDVWLVINAVMFKQVDIKWKQR